MKLHFEILERMKKRLMETHFAVDSHFFHVTVNYSVDMTVDHSVSKTISGEEEAEAPFALLAESSNHSSPLIFLHCV